MAYTEYYNKYTSKNGIYADRHGDIMVNLIFNNVNDQNCTVVSFFKSKMYHGWLFLIKKIE